MLWQNINERKKTNETNNKTVNGCNTNHNDCDKYI